MILRAVVCGRLRLSCAPCTFSSWNRSDKLLHASFRQFGSALEEMKDKERSIRPRPRPPKLRMEPYVKNLFNGIIDPHVFAFPELDQGSSAIVDDMRVEMENFMNSGNISTFSNGCNINTEMISKLKELGIFKANIPRQYGGLELTCSEMICLAEVFAKDLSLYHTLNTHLHYISNLFCIFARSEQKEEYLPLIASGDLQIGFALWEENAGVDVSNLNTTVSYLGDQYVLSGKKLWVCNGGIADKFVVFARDDAAQGSPNCISCFLVDKKSEGVSAKSMDTLGVHGYKAWEVTFDRTPVPKENVIGPLGEGLSMIRSLVHSNKFTLSGACVGLLKDLLNTTLQRAINKETFGKPVIEHDIVKKHIAEAATRIYALESISFMTADFYDNIEDPDMEVEAAIVKLYSSEALSYVVQKCFTILGSDVYLKDKPYERILRDSLFSPLVESSADSLRMTIALLCLKHAGKNFQKIVIERRNPLHFPKKTIMSHLKDLMLTEGSDCKDIIFNHVHPSLEMAARLLEKSIEKLGKTTEETLVKWGNKIDDKQMNLARLADIAVELYVSTAVLARTSRAISIGLRNADVDAYMSLSVIFDASNRVNALAEDLDNSPYNNSDANHLKIVETMLHERKYHASHPLERNY